jgi:hypothetical protein
MGLPRPPGYAGIKAWFVKVLNSRLGRVEHGQAQALPKQTRPFSQSTRPRLHTNPRTANTGSRQARGYHQFSFPKFNRPIPRFPGVRVKLHSSTVFIRGPIGAFPKSPWNQPGLAQFHTSPASGAVALNQIADSVSTALRNGLHSQPAPQGGILAEVTARIACNFTDGPAGYIRFNLSPPAWTPTDSDLSDPDIIKAIDTQIAELQRVRAGLLKLKEYGDFPVRVVLPANPEPAIDVLFRGASADDVARWNKNEFKLASGRVGADQIFCAARFEDYVKWSEVLDIERTVDGEYKRDQGLLKFWDELNQLEGRIH